MNKFILKELKNLVLGKNIGSGTYRNVYLHRQRKDLVIKVEETAKSFSNITEWSVWNDIKESKIAKYFAPCEDISPCGSILLMKRVHPVRIEEMPRHVPSIFTDLKIQNWGMLEGNIVCCDYGNLILGAAEKLNKAEWWSYD